MLEILLRFRNLPLTYQNTRISVHSSLLQFWHFVQLEIDVMCISLWWKEIRFHWSALSIFHNIQMCGLSTLCYALIIFCSISRALNLLYTFECCHSLTYSWPELSFDTFRYPNNGKWKQLQSYISTCHAFSFSNQYNSEGVFL